MFSDLIMSILEIIGTISFAVSGAFVAIKARLDLFGVLFIGVITAVGGGIVRDVLIGRFPAAIFAKFPLVALAAFSALIVFVVTYVLREKFHTVQVKVEHVNNFFDAVGLAAFSVMGTEVAFTQGLSDNMFLSVTLGMITGVGGGIFRDILADTTPYIFKKHVYALASILGSIIYCVLRQDHCRLITASVVSMLLVVAIRLLAAKYHWGLPKIDLSGTKHSAKH